jgi:hypothetical protein
MQEERQNLSFGRTEAGRYNYAWPIERRTCRRQKGLPPKKDRIISRRDNGIIGWIYQRRDKDSQQTVHSIANDCLTGQELALLASNKEVSKAQT